MVDCRNPVFVRPFWFKKKRQKKAVKFLGLTAKIEISIFNASGQTGVVGLPEKIFHNLKLNTIK